MLNVAIPPTTSTAATAITTVMVHVGINDDKLNSWTDVASLV